MVEYHNRHEHSKADRFNKKEEVKNGEQLCSWDEIRVLNIDHSFDWPHKQECERPCHSIGKDYYEEGFDEYSDGHLVLVAKISIYLFPIDLPALLSL